MRCHWKLSQPESARVSVLCNALRISPILAQCLINRGVFDAASAALFLEPRLKNLSDPFLLPNMQAAVDRLFAARAAGELFVIFGDYDVDGITATALLLIGLRSLEWKVEAYLPHRRDEGYGLSAEGVLNCLGKFPVRLLLALDCGSNAVETIQMLADRNVGVIVVDHHQVSNPPPRAVALVNPRLNGTEADGVELCSAGLAFKLLHAVIKHGRAEGSFSEELDIRDLLDFAALGTIADLVPLKGESRILAATGLARLNKSRRVGIESLCNVAGLTGSIGGYEIGFQLGPRLNAAGRLEHASAALDLLLCEDMSEALKIATGLDVQNRERQRIEREIARTVVERVKASFKPESDLVLVECDPDWHIGVVGIVASRLHHEFYRPAFVLGGDGACFRGSGRSIEGFDLAAALHECRDLLIKQGGHAMAAGITIANDRIGPFKERMNQIAARLLSPEQLVPRLRIDAQVTIEDLTLDFVGALEKLQPFGPGCPSVHLAIRNVSHQRTPQRMGADKQHAKFWIGTSARQVEAVWWNCGPEAALPKVSFDLAFVPQINHFNGRSSVQLKVLDWRAIESSSS